MIFNSELEKLFVMGGLNEDLVEKSGFLDDMFVLNLDTMIW
jgi:hypothetical protein